ncbi:hypothetical protein [Steroidobacter sp.]|uniref:hypothetical protein n=1 Tax=Steroidobacter sp. TaxID=1978227 RepID=UPI001A373FBD|nr:hypothetical protein [Steroidobacter sp.]MBL8269557.1 hypothetical protein [Steroidobacter sp.]
MHTFCPEGQAQMDFFGVSPPPAPDDIESISDDALDPLEDLAVDDIDLIDGDDAEEDAPKATARRDVPEGTAPPQIALGLESLPLNHYEWSDEECCHFLDAMLVNQLRLLNDERTTPELRADLIAWIAAPKRSLSELKKAPCSFQACCAAAGVDFEEMRERTLAMFAPELIDQLD